MAYNSPYWGVRCMVAFILGASVMFNLLFISMWIYGMWMQKKDFRNMKKILRNAQLRPDLYQDWMFEA